MTPEEYESRREEMTQRMHKIAFEREKLECEQRGRSKIRSLFQNRSALEKPKSNPKMKIRSNVTETILNWTWKYVPTAFGLACGLVAYFSKDPVY